MHDSYANSDFSLLCCIYSFNLVTDWIVKGNVKTERNLTSKVVALYYQPQLCNPGHKCNAINLGQTVLYPGSMVQIFISFFISYPCIIH